MAKSEINTPAVAEAPAIQEAQARSQYDRALQSISRQSGLVLIGKIGFQIINFISSIILARFLGPALLGMYQLGLVTIQILSIVSLLGFDRGMVRFIPVFNLEQKGKIKKLIADALVIVTGFSALLAVCCYLQAELLARIFFHSEPMAPVLRSFSIYIPILTIFGFGIATLRGFKRADLESFYDNLFAPMLFVGFLLVILFVGGQLFEVILARVASRIICIIGIFYFLAKKFANIFAQKAISYERKRFFSYSIPLLLISLIYFAIGKINILLLGYFLNSDQVGIYSVLMYIATLGVFGLQAVNTIFAPYISEIYQTGNLDSVEKLLKVLTRWIFYFSLLVLVIIIVYHQELLQIYGAEYIIGSRALIILAIGHLVNAFTGSTGAILLMTGKQHWEIINSVAILALNILANIYFIPRFGLDGAAIAFSLAIGIINILKVLETYKEFRIHPYNRQYLKGLLALGVAAVIGYLSQYFFSQWQFNYILNLLAGMVIISGVAGFMLFLLKLDSEDHFVLRKIVQKFRPGSLPPASLKG